MQTGSVETRSRSRRRTCAFHFPRFRASEALHAWLWLWIVGATERDFTALQAAAALRSLAQERSGPFLYGTRPPSQRPTSMWGDWHVSFKSLAQNKPNPERLLLDSRDLRLFCAMEG